MKYLIIVIGCLFLVGCGYTAEERIELDWEQRKKQNMRDLKEQMRIEQLGEDRVWCESLCLSNWDKEPKMECTVNCVNALKSGELVIK